MSSAQTPARGHQFPSARLQVCYAGPQDPREWAEAIAHDLFGQVIAVCAAEGRRESGVSVVIDLPGVWDREEIFAGLSREPGVGSILLQAGSESSYRPGAGELPA